MVIRKAFEAAGVDFINGNGDGPEVKLKRKIGLMDEMFSEMMTSLRDGQKALDQEVHPLLQAETPDLTLLMRLRDVADEYAARAQVLRQMMTDKGADADQFEEVVRLCRYFDGTADLIAQETGDSDQPAGSRSDLGVDQERGNDDRGPPRSRVPAH